MEDHGTGVSQTDVTIAVWIEGIEGRDFARFVHENEKELGPGCRMGGKGIVLSIGRMKVPEFAKEVVQEGKKGVPTGFDNRVSDTGDSWRFARREVGDDSGKELQIERSGRGGERVRDARGGRFISKVEDMCVIVTHDVRGVGLVPCARGVTSFMMTDCGATVVEGLDDQGGVGGRWSFGPHSRVGRGVGINLSREWWIVCFT